MSVRLLKVLILFSIVFSSLSFAAQGPQSFTLDGILKQAGTNNPLLDAAVTITVQIMDPTKQCLLYEEQQTVNTTTSKGYFNIVVGSDLGSPKRTGNDPGLATYQIYQNSGAVIASNVPGQTCAGGLFTPVTQDYRYMRIIVTPSSTGVADTLSPDTLMDAVPAAVVAEWAESVGGFTPNDLLKVNVSGGMNLSQVNLESLFTPAAWPNLQAVAAGNFMNKTANNGAALPTYTTGAPPIAPAEGSIWFDSDTNQIKYYDGAATQTVGTSGMGVTSVDTTTNFTVDGVAGGTITSTGEIDLSNTGVVAGTYPKVQVDAKGRVLAGTATLLETDLPAVIDDPGRVSGDAITSGTIGGSTSISTTGTISAASASFRQIDLYDSDNSNYVRFLTPATGVLTSNYTLTFPANAGTSGQALTTDGSGGLAWTTIVTDVGNTADLSNGLVWIGDGAGTAQERQISGDIAITNTGVATIQADTVTYAKIQNVTDNRLLGRSAGSAGDVQEIQIGTGLTMAAGTIALTDTTDDDTLGGLSCANNEVPRWNGAAWVCQLANNASSNNTLVLRDGSGSFGANVVTTTTTTADTMSVTNGSGSINITNPGASYNLILPPDDGNAGQVLSTNGTGTLSWIDALTSATGYINGGNSFGADATIGLNDNFRLDIETNNTPRITVEPGGNVGVGTTAPTNKLSVLSSFDVHNAGGSKLTVVPNWISIKPIGSSGAGFSLEDDNRKWQLAKETSGKLHFYDATAAAHRMVLDTVGNVGIGVTDPDVKLEVAGTVRVGNGGETCSGGNFTGGIRYNGGNLQFCNGVSWQTLGLAGSGITSLTGDVTATGPGAAAATIANDAVTSAKILDGTIATGDLADDAVTYAKIQNVTDNRLLGRSAGGAGDVQEIQIGTGLTMAAGTIALTDTTDDDALGALSCAANEVPIWNGGAWVCQLAAAANGNGSLVLRDGSGNFASNNITANGFSVNNAGSLVNISSPVGANYSLILPAAVGSANQVLTAVDGAGTLGWSTPLTSSTGYLNGGNTFGADASIGLNDNFRLDVKTNNAVRMTIAADGDVGIGTTDPAAKFEVSGGDAIIHTLTVGSGGGANQKNTAFGLSALASNTTGENNTAIGREALMSNTTMSFMTAVGQGALRSNTSTVSGSAAFGAGALYANTTGTSSVAVGTFSLLNSTTGSYNTGLGHRAMQSATTASQNTAAGYQVLNSLTTGDGNTAIGYWAGKNITTGANNIVIGRVDAVSATANDQLNIGNLIFGSGVGVGTTLSTGNVGIGVTDADVKLEIAGTLRVGDGGETCSGGNFTGGIRYSGGNLQFCDGNAWNTLGLAGSGITSLTGDVTATGPGAAAATIANDAVTSAKILDGTIATGDLADDAVNFAKMQNINTQRLLGRGTAAVGNVEEISLGAGLTLTGTTLDVTDGTDDDALGALSCAANEVPKWNGSAWVCQLAESANGNGSLVLRDGTGNFASNQITANTFSVNNAGSLVNLVSPIGANYTLTLPAAVGSANQVLTATDGAGTLGWSTVLTSGTGYVNGGNSFGADASIGLNDNFRLDVKTNNTTRMTIAAGGNVGIGDTNPAAPLHISTTDTAGAQQLTKLRLQRSIYDTDGDADYIDWYSGAATTIGRISLARTASGQSGMGFWTFDNGNGGIREQMRIDRSGNVGIGTTAPTSALHVFRNDSGVDLRARSAVTGANKIVADNYLYTTGTAGTYNNFYGNRSTVWAEVNAGGSISQLTGTHNEIYKGMGGSLSDMAAVKNVVMADGGTITDVYGSSTEFYKMSGTVTNMYGNHMYVYNDNAVTNFYGLYLDLESTQATNDDFGIYVKTPQRNYFAGNVGIGTTNPARLLHVNGPLRVQPAALPGTPAAGDIAIDSGASNALKYYDGSSWVTVGASGGGDFMADGSVAMTGAFRASDGTQAAPSITFASDTNTGFYSSGVNDGSFEMTLDGVHTMAFNVGQISSYAPISVTNGSVANPDLSFSGNSSTGTGFYAPATNQLGVATNGVERMRVDASGNVGIGTTSPSGTLEVSSPTNASLVVTNTDPTANPYSHITIKNYRKTWGAGHPAIISYAANGTPSAPTPLGADQLFLGLEGRGYSEPGFWDTQASAYIRAYASSAWGGGGSKPSYMTIGTNKTERIRIDSAGNVGIGTTSPARLLHVNGPLRVQPAALPGTPAAGDIAIDSGASNALKYYDGSGWVTLGAAGGGDFMANGSVAMTGTFKATDGTAAAPSITFNSDQDTGMYRGAANDIRFANGGAQSFRILGSSDAYISNGLLRLEGGSAGSPAFGFQNDVNTGLFNPLDDVIAFSAGGSERMRVNGSGYVGIGTTNPTAKLQVVPGTYGIGQGLIVGATTAGSTNLVLDVSAATNGYAGLQAIKSQGSTFGDIVLNPSGGNVGIGTTNPLFKFHVDAGSSGAGGLIHSNTYTSFEVASYANTAGWEAPYLTLRRSRGNYSSPTYPLSGDLLGELGFRNYTNSDGASIKGFASQNHSGSLAGTMLVFSTVTNGSNSSSERMRIDASGNVGIGTTNPTEELHVNGDILAVSYLYTSDRRLKKDIEPLDSSIEKLIGLDTISYRWISPQAEDAKGKQIGLIAQEVQKVYPEAVKEGEDGYLRVDYPALVAPVINALRELYNMILGVDQRTAELQAEVEKLKSENAKLKADLEAKDKSIEERLRQLEQTVHGRAPASKK